MRNMKLLAVMVAVLGLAFTVQAADYKVGAGQAYATVQAGLNAALGNASGTHTVTIMDSAVYDEYIMVNSGVGSTGVSITVAPDAGQTPTIYGARFNGGKANITFDGLIVDGNLRTGGSRQAYLLYMRYGKDGTTNTFRNLTVKGTGSQRSGVIYTVGTGGSFVMEGNTFEADSVSVQSKGIKSGYSSGDNDAMGSIVIKNNTFSGSDLYGVDADTWKAGKGPITVNNNIFNGMANAGIYRRDAEALTTLTIENNTFYKCGGPTSYLDGAILFRDSTTTFGPTVLDNLIVGDGAAVYEGLNAYTTAITDIDADYNGFSNLSDGANKVLYASGWKTLAELNAYASAGNNILNDTDPFVDAANGDFRLTASSWANNAASDGEFIGALAPVPEPATMALLAIGGVGVLLRRRRR